MRRLFPKNGAHAAQEGSWLQMLQTPEQLQRKLTQEQTSHSSAQTK